MSQNLVIVESPSKAKTIEKFLGKSYKVLASVGHIRDLPKSKLGVDVDNDFEPQYISIRGKGKVIAELKKEAKKSKHVYIATDPDREGEAIAWHISNILNLSDDIVKRIEFREITKNAVKEAIKHPRDINMDLVDSQQARRIIDRLMGYKISPILWRKVMRGLSAGRVQSVATKIIIDREREIEAFKTDEYWNVFTTFKYEKDVFKAQLTKYNNKKFKSDNEADSKKVKSEILNEKHTLSKVEQKNRVRKQPTPFTTSSLQQEASSRLNFSALKTMRIAQSLYEGKKIKGGIVGLITYMRTDSVRISEEAREEAYEFINENYGKEYVTKYSAKNKGKNTQDAHEAIRVTSVNRTPKDLEKYLTKDEYKLYTLIWNRFIASQMAAAKYLTTKYVITSKSFESVAKGEVLVFDGFSKIYTYNNKKDQVLPIISEGSELDIKEVELEQKFTQPPSRFTEASLIKELEEKGIGRPSTYAPTITTILKRNYISKEKKLLVPTELGKITNEIMENNFEKLVEYDFTANLEKNLDTISEGDENWKELIRSFYETLLPLLTKAEDNVKRYDLSELTDIDCEKCSSKMLIKKTIKGEFLACSNYPECKNTKPILKEIGVDCPLCDTGKIVERKTKKLKVFYGCSNFPECRFASWTKPINEKCSECGSLLSEGNGKMRAFIVCTNKECTYKRKKGSSN